MAGVHDDVWLVFMVMYAAVHILFCCSTSVTVVGVNDRIDICYGLQD